MSRVIKRWIWRDRLGRPHNCVEFEDGSKYVFERKKGKVVIRPLTGDAEG